MKQNVIQINGGIITNFNVPVKKLPAPCNCEHGKYLASIRGDPMITCDEIMWWGDKNYSNKF